MAVLNKHTISGLKEQGLSVRAGFHHGTPPTELTQEYLEWSRLSSEYLLEQLYLEALVEDKRRDVLLAEMEIEDSAKETVFKNTDILSLQNPNHPDSFAKMLLSVPRDGIRSPVITGYQEGDSVVSRLTAPSNEASENLNELRTNLIIAQGKLNRHNWDEPKWLELISDEVPYITLEQLREIERQLFGNNENYQ